jgi:hypothetical protein
MRAAATAQLGRSSPYKPKGENQTLDIETREKELIEEAMSITTSIAIDGRWMRI